MNKLPITDTYPLELSTGAKTLFYVKLGANTIWGFKPPNGKPGVAITDGKTGQIVCNRDNLKELMELLDSSLEENIKQ